MLNTRVEPVPMNRWKAAGIHLCLSFLVIGTIVFCALYFWFPYRLSVIAGLDRLFETMLVIDLVAGPLLTCVVYKSDKRLLRRDLSVIALVQMAFLAYGIHTTWASRPVLLVGAVDRLTLIFANEIAPKDLAKGRTPETRRLSWTGPLLVGTLPPDNQKEREALMFAAIAGGTDIDRLPKYYVPFERAAPGLLQHALPVDASIPSADIRSVGKPPGEMRILPITSSRGDARILIDAATARPLRVIAPGLSGQE
jgi:hypothetical protein